MGVGGGSTVKCHREQGAGKLWARRRMGAVTAQGFLATGWLGRPMVARLT